MPTGGAPDGVTETPNPPAGGATGGPGDVDAGGYCMPPTGGVTPGCGMPAGGGVLPGGEAMPVDGVYLALHGAMAVRNVPKPEAEVARRFRDVVGPDLELVHDVHERLPPADAVRFAKDLEPARLFFLEDLLAPIEGVE